MILTIDIGNSNITIGAYRGNELFVFNPDGHRSDQNAG